MGVRVVNAIGEMLPCTTMVIIEAVAIFLTIMASTAMSKFGMSSFIFVVYTNALSFILLIPYSLFFHRRDKYVYIFTESCFLFFFKIKGDSEDRC